MASTCPTFGRPRGPCCPLGIDVARWYTDPSKPSPTALGRQYADLVLRMLGAKVS